MFFCIPVDTKNWKRTQLAPNNSALQGAAAYQLGNTSSRTITKVKQHWAYHSLLTQDQRQRIERLQKRSLEIINPQMTSYADELEKLGIESLEDRRKSLVRNFVQNIVEHPNFAERWFPKKERHGYGIRKEKVYRQAKCNTERAKNSPLNYFRTLLRAMNGWWRDVWIVVFLHFFL